MNSSDDYRTIVHDCIIYQSRSIEAGMQPNLQCAHIKESDQPEHSHDLSTQKNLGPSL